MHERCDLFQTIYSSIDYKKKTITGYIKLEKEVQVLPYLKGRFTVHGI
jgi:hypothetical protein